MIAHEPGLAIRKVGPEALQDIARLNEAIFKETRIINSFERDDLLMLLAEWNGEPVGFKLGYRQNRMLFYSAKGGVVASHRRRGVAQALLDEMLLHVQVAGYRRFAFDTFPNMHPGMAVLALQRGFRLTEAEFNPTYRDFRLRFEIGL